MIISFLHTLYLYPEVAQRVYEEIQGVTHGQRPPTISDRSSLPYTEAVFKESIRKRPFVPVGKSPSSRFRWDSSVWS
jgi:cytochrome P450